MRSDSCNRKKQKGNKNINYDKVTCLSIYNEINRVCTKSERLNSDNAYYGWRTFWIKKQK